MANSAALALSVSNTVSTSRRSTPPSHSPRDGFAVGGDQFVEAGVAVARVVDVGRDRRRARGRAEAAGDEARPARVAGGELVAGRARQLRAGDVQLVHDGFEVVVGLRDAGRVEGVGFDDVRASRQILGVDRADQIGLGQQQQVVVALQVVRMRGEAAAAVIRLLQPWRWIIVPMAPSRTRIFLSRQALSSAVRSGCMR
jgi:hypothetical protein